MSHQKLLFIETFLLGDLLYLGPLLKKMRAECPEAQIEVLTSQVTRHFPFFDDLNVTMHPFEFPWSRPGWYHQPHESLRALAKLGKLYRDRFRDHVMLDPRGDVRHSLVAHLLHPKRFIQYRSGARWQDAWRGINPHHTFVNRQNFLREVAWEFHFSSARKLQWPWLESFRPDGVNASRDVVFAPEASNRLRFWQPEKWRSLARKLRQNGWKVTLVSHAENALPSPQPAEFDKIWKGSIRNLAQLLGSARALIAVDSFPGHLAAAVGTPVVSLFGPTSPECWRPWGRQTVTVTAQGYPCRRLCSKKKCVHPEDNCMDAIEVEQVLHAFNQITSSS